MLSNHSFTTDDGIQCRMIFCIDHVLGLPASLKLSEPRYYGGDSGSVSTGTYVSESTGQTVYALYFFRTVPESTQELFIMTTDQRLSQYTDEQIDGLMDQCCRMVSISSPVPPKHEPLRREDYDDVIAQLIFGCDETK